MAIGRTNAGGGSTFLPNLLDNSDFQHFVAQAGVAGKHGTQAYAGDRWILDSGTVTGTESAYGNGYSGITLNGTIRQIVAEPPAGEYACAVEMVSGTATIAYANGEVTITSSGGVLKNAGLYAGSRAPKYVSKGYSAELMECQRYYFGTPLTNSYLSWAGYTHTTTDARLTIPLGTMMRMKPTVTFTDPAEPRLYYNGTDVAISNVVAAELTPNGVTVVLRGSNLAAGVLCALKLNCGFSMSADL